MKLGFSLMFIAASCVGLTGCANWQNRTGTAGSAADSSLMLPPPPPPGPGDSLLSAPGAGFGEPGPAMPPPPSSDPFLTLPPAGAPPERLNLSQGSSSTGGSASSPVPGRMYNLEPSAPKKQTAAKSSSSSASSSSSSGPSKTISRLASKSEPTASSTGSSSTAAKTAEEAPKAGSNTLARLSRSASQDNAESKPSPTSLPRPEVPAEPAVAAPTAQPAESSPEPVFDTSFLAQPVRKGADSGTGNNDDSKGPQSNHIPKRRGLGDDIRPMIYPVSNPAVDEPVDITQFT